MSSIIIGIQARSNSVRFPNKVMAKIGGKPCIDLIVNAALTSGIGKVALLIPLDDPLYEYGANIKNLIVLPGPPGDLLTHFWELSNVLPHDYYMRLTADCPLVTADLIEESRTIFLHQPVPYWCNRRWYPDGFDIEIFSHPYLQMAHVAVTDPDERNHCVAGAVANKFAEHFLSLDYEADLEKIEQAKRQIN